MTDPTSSRRSFLKLGGAGLLAGLAGCDAPASTTPTEGEAGASPTPGEPGTASPTPTAAASPSNPDGAESATEGSSTDGSAGSVYTRVYREAIDSVVLVEAERGQGTGFVFDAEGPYVVTNAHVVGRASEVDVRFDDGRWFTGEVAGTDEDSDLAAIGIDASVDAPALPFCEGDPAIGQEVVALGNPYNLDGSVTTGIVSGLNRSIPAPTGYRIPDAVQTDAAVNPGNSGGPLMSLEGCVLAVINSGGGENIAFGISAALTRRVVASLVETGSYEHSYLGATLATVTPAVADANDLEEARGLIVVDVADGGPANGALRGSELRFAGGSRLPVGGDVILAIDDVELRTTEELGSYLALRTRPGDTVALTVLRDGDRRTVEVELAARP